MLCVKNFAHYSCKLRTFEYTTEKLFDGFDTDHKFLSLVFSNCSLLEEAHVCHTPAVALSLDDVEKLFVGSAVSRYRYGARNAMSIVVVVVDREAVHCLICVGTYCHSDLIPAGNVLSLNLVPLSSPLLALIPNPKFL